MEPGNLQRQPPKKYLTAFEHFCRDQRKSVRQQTPSGKYKTDEEADAYLEVIWLKLHKTDQFRLMCQEMEEGDKKRYFRELKEYQAYKQNDRTTIPPGWWLLDVVVDEACDMDILKVCLWRSV